MWLYLIIIFLPIIHYFTTVNKKTNSKVFLFVYICFLTIFVGMSDMFGGYDRYIYGEIFDTIADVTTINEDYLSQGCFDYFAGEFGFTILNILISFISENRYIFILIVTIIIYWLLYLSIKKYTCNYPLALVLFMGLWFYFTFTYLRQVLGATIVWLSIDYIIKRDLKRFIIIWFIAYSMHNSAIIFLPFYFVATKKYQRNHIYLAIVLALLAGITPIPNLLFNAYQSVSIFERANDYNALGGFRIAYLLQSTFFLLIIIPIYKKINTQKEIVIFNMSLVFCILLLFFVKSENGGRLSWYYMLGIISTITTICTKFYKKPIFVVLVIAICLFQYTRIFNAWQLYLNLYPYKSFLTNGYRKGDYSWENFEYDHNYDENKLYRKAFRF